MIGFGLDLSGYTRSGTSLAAVVVNGDSAEVILLRNSALSRRRSTSSSLREIVKCEARDLKRCLEIGPLAVDIPIDLQNLLHPERSEVIWELTRRPIDEALNAMPPVADRIGAPVARFAAIMREGKFSSHLGKDLFETYPSESYRRLTNSHNGNRQEVRAAFFRGIALNTIDTSEDDLDAILCAIAAVAPEDYLVTEKDFALERGKLPAGFRVLKRSPFCRLTLKQQDFSTWLTGLTQATSV